MMLKDDPEKHPYPLRFATSSMMGYGLYEKRMLSLDECLKTFQKDKPYMYSPKIYKLGETDYSVERWDVFGENISFLRKPKMLGAIVGDVVGSVYERHNIKTKDFPLLTEKSHFTDDTVITLAVAEALMRTFPERDGKWHEEDAEKLEATVVETMREFGAKFPNAGYGGGFRRWLNSSHPHPYESYGNGAAMRISPVAWAFDTLEDVEKCAYSVTRVTHNHPEAIIAFLESMNFEDAVRQAISLGGDSYTLAAITGSIAEGAWGIPDEIAEQIFEKLDPSLQDTLTRWDKWRESQSIEG